MKFLTNISPRDYQKKILETCKKDNCLVVLPTGLGKTLIALMLAIERIENFPKEKVVFLAPTRPLAEQHFSYFAKHLHELFAELVLFTGKIKPEKRKELWKVSDIIFSTPQCAANDLKKNLYSLKDVCLLVEDEAHRCIKNYDYTYLSKRYQKESLHPRIIGLTASPGSDLSKVREICDNLFIKEVEIRTRESEDVKRYIQELEFEKIFIELPKKFDEVRNALLQLFGKYIEELKKRGILWEAPSKSGLISLQKKISSALSRNSGNFNYMYGASACAQAIRIQHALELLETQTISGFNKYLKKIFSEASKKKSKGVVKLASQPEFNFAYSSSNELITKNIEHPKIEKLIEVVKQEKIKNKKIKIIIFAQFRDTLLELSKKLNEIENIKASVFVGQAKKIFDGKSTGLNQKEQKRMIEKFSSGEINVLCATSIGEEGLDIPEVGLVIFYDNVPSAIRTIQRGGRTARLKEGKIIMLITKKTRDETFFYVSKAKQKKMQSIISTLKDDLKNEKINFKEEQKEIGDYLK